MSSREVVLVTKVDYPKENRFYLQIDFDDGSTIYTPYLQEDEVTGDKWRYETTFIRSENQDY